MKNYCVYKITFPNLKVYIGITNNFKNRMRQHKNSMKTHSNIKLYNALVKYGFENCKFEMIYENLIVEDARNKEIELIEKFNSTKEGYNTSFGGSTAPILNDEVKRKILEKIQNEEHREMKSKKMREVFSANPDMRKKISESSKKVWENKREQIVSSHLENYNNPEFRRKMKKAREKGWNNQERRDKASKQMKQRMSIEENKNKARDILNSPEVIEKRNAIKRTPEWREAQSLRLKEHYRKKKVQVEQEQVNRDAQAFLDSSDWQILRHIRQQALGEALSLSEEAYLELEQLRSDAAASIVN